MAEPEHDDAEAGQLRSAAPVGDAGADRGLDAHRRERARVAGAAAVGGQAGHVAGELGDHDHVLGPGADVLGGDVAAVERLDHLGEVEQHVAAQLAGRAVDGAVARGASGSLPCRRRGRARPRPPCRSSRGPAAARRRRRRARVANGHIRTPPSAGPRTVEWIATITSAPLRGPRRTTSSSWSSSSAGAGRAPSGADCARVAAADAARSCRPSRASSFDLTRLEPALDRREEARRDGAVEGSVVPRHAQVGHRPDRDRVAVRALRPPPVA